MRMFKIKQEPCCGIIIGSSQLISADPVVLFHPIGHFQAVGPLFKHATPRNEYLCPVVREWKSFILYHSDHAWSLHPSDPARADNTWLLVLQAHVLPMCQSSLDNVP